MSCGGGSSITSLIFGLWKKVSGALTPKTEGDDFLLKDSSGNTTLFHDASEGSTQSGRTDEAGVVEVKDASNVIQAKLNSAGSGYHVNKFGFGTKTPNASVTINGDASIKRTEASTGYNPSVKTSDCLIAVTGSGARSVVIPTEDIEAGTTALPILKIIKDEAGNSATGNITITLENSGTINGAANFVISINYACVWLYLDGTNAYTIAEFD